MYYKKLNKFICLEKFLQFKPNDWNSQGNIDWPVVSWARDQQDHINEVDKDMTKEKLLGLMKNSDDAIIHIGDGSQYVVYSPYSNNKDNADMWSDESVFALDSDGGSHEIYYRDIVDVDVYEGKKVNEENLLSSEEIYWE